MIGQQMFIFREISYADQWFRKPFLVNEMGGGVKLGGGSIREYTVGEHICCTLKPPLCPCGEGPKASHGYSHVISYLEKGY